MQSREVKASTSWVESSEVEVELQRAPVIKEASTAAAAAAVVAGGVSGGAPPTNAADDDGANLNEEANLDAKKQTKLEPTTTTPTKQPMTLGAKIVCGFAIASVVFQILSLALKVPFQSGWGKWVLVVAAVIGLVLGAFAWVVEYRYLGGIDSLRKVQNELRKEANRLREANEELSSSVQDLSTQTNRLQDSEEALNQIAQAQSKNVESIMNATKQNKIFLNSMERVLQQKVLHDFYAVILRSDRNRDMTITNEELDILSLRLSNISGISINEDVFLAKARSCSGSLEKIFEFIGEHVLGKQQDGEDSPFDLDKESVRKEMTY